MNVRLITIALALLTIVIAAAAAYTTRDWMPLVMAGPVALIVLVNSSRAAKP